MTMIYLLWLVSDKGQRGQEQTPTQAVGEERKGKGKGRKKKVCTISWDGMLITLQPQPIPFPSIVDYQSRIQVQSKLQSPRA